MSIKGTEFKYLKKPYRVYFDTYPVFTTSPHGRNWEQTGLNCVVSIREIMKDGEEALFAVGNFNLGKKKCEKMYYWTDKPRRFDKALAIVSSIADKATPCDDKFVDLLCCDGTTKNMCDKCRLVAQMNKEAKSLHRKKQRGELKSPDDDFWGV